MKALVFAFVAMILLAAMASASIVACSPYERTDSSVSDAGNSTNKSEDKLPLSDPGIRGVITKSDSTAGSRNILVEEDPADASGSQKASIRVTSQTKIYRRSGSGLETIDQAQLTTGKKVSVWFEGPVAESYPVQGTADVILLES